MKISQIVAFLFLGIWTACAAADELDDSIRQERLQQWQQKYGTVLPSQDSGIAAARQRTDTIGGYDASIYGRYFWDQIEARENRIAQIDRDMKYISGAGQTGSQSSNAIINPLLQGGSQAPAAGAGINRLSPEVQELLNEYTQRGCDDTNRYWVDLDSRFYNLDGGQDLRCLSLGAQLGMVGQRLTRLNSEKQRLLSEIEEIKQTARYRATLGDPDSNVVTNARIERGMIERGDVGVERARRQIAAPKAIGDGWVEKK